MKLPGPDSRVSLPLGSVGAGNCEEHVQPVVKAFLASCRRNGPLSGPQGDLSPPVQMPLHLPGLLRPADVAALSVWNNGLWALSRSSYS